LTSRKPTTYDVAKLASVSQATVSYVLSGRMDVSIPEETRDRILRAARSLRYRSNTVARALVLGKSQTIGVIAPQMGLDYHSHILQGIYSGSVSHSYRILIGYFDHDPELGARQVNFLLEHQVEGFICIGDEGATAGMPKWLDIMAAENLPCVIVDERTYSQRVDCIVSDDIQGAMEATRHLIRLGHKRIGHLSAGVRMSTSRDRNTGYRTAMAEAGLEVGPYSVVEGSYFLEEGSHAAEKLLELSGVTAVVAANDLLALLVREEALRLGLNVPNDLAITGYGNTDIASPLRLTSVDQHPQTLGQIAAERLMKRLVEPALPVEEIKVPTRLIVRQTSMPREGDSAKLSTLDER
jgi:DNA-binding LacI/PurR family transcriptional regulator